MILLTFLLQKKALPNLQSVVIVLLKAILQNVTAIIAQGVSQQHPGLANRGPNGNVNGQSGANRQDGANGANSPLSPEPSIEDIDASRTREITAKAATGIMLLMLKWFKLSRKSWFPNGCWQAGQRLTRPQTSSSLST